MMFALTLAPSTTGFLAGLSTPKQNNQPLYPGAGAASEVGSTGLPGDIGFDPLGLANFDLSVDSATDKERSSAYVMRDYEAWFGDFVGNLSWPKPRPDANNSRDSRAYTPPPDVARTYQVVRYGARPVSRTRRRVGPEVRSQSSIRSDRAILAASRTLFPLFRFHTQTPQPNTLLTLTYTRTQTRISQH